MQFKEQNTISYRLGVSFPFINYPEHGDLLARQTQGELTHKANSSFMAKLTIQYKLFLAMFAWSALLIAVLALSIQRSLDVGMIDYVNQKEVDNIMPLVETLGSEFLKDGNWTAYEERTGKFRRLLEKQLFSLGAPAEPHHVRGAHLRGPSARGPEDRRPPPRRRTPTADALESLASDTSGPAAYGPGDNQGRQNMLLENGVQELPPFRNGGPGPLISYVLLDKEKKLIAGFYPPDRDYTYVEIKPLSDVVGYFAVSKRNALADGYELKFLDKQQQHLFVIATVLLLVTFALTLPFARHLVRPIRQVASSLSKLSKGQYNTELATKRSDEFQLLFQNINNLAKTLAENESARKKWFADTAHDLRTPIAIMRGELEAMLDGVRNMDTKQVESIHSETLRLQRFITDLHELARSELGTQHYQKVSLDVNRILLDVADHCQQLLSEHQVQLNTHLPETETLYLADEFRLAQCFDNLLTNIASYAHHATRADISLFKDHDSIKIVVEDDGQGVEDEHLSKLFDHLYRVDGSRNRGQFTKETGGSGLGLAICKNIIEAHNGKIWAEKSKLGGLAIVITLPFNS